MDALRFLSYMQRTLFLAGAQKPNLNFNLNLNLNLRLKPNRPRIHNSKRLEATRVESSRESSELCVRCWSVQHVLISVATAKVSKRYIRLGPSACIHSYEWRRHTNILYSFVYSVFSMWAYDQHEINATCLTEWRLKSRREHIALIVDCLHLHFPKLYVPVQLADGTVSLSFSYLSVCLSCVSIVALALMKSDKLLL